MKIMIAMGLLLAFILVFSFYMNNQVSDISKDLMVTLGSIEQKVETEQWEKALISIEKLQMDWENAIIWWTPMMDHREVDALDHAIARLSRQVSLKEKEEALAEISLAKRMVHRINDREKVMISNIF